MAVIVWYTLEGEAEMVRFLYAAYLIGISERCIKFRKQGAGRSCSNAIKELALTRCNSISWKNREICSCMQILNSRVFKRIPRR